MNHEFDMFETRLAMIGDVVDVFALHEASVTNDGRPKQPLFYNRFKQVNNDSEAFVANLHFHQRSRLPFFLCIAQCMC